MCLLSLSLHKMKLLNIASVYISKICWRTSCDLRLLCPKVIAIIYTKTKRLLLHAPRLLCHSTKTRMALHNVSVYHKNSHLYTYCLCMYIKKWPGLSYVPRLLCLKVITTIYTKRTRISSNAPQLLCPVTKFTPQTLDDSVHQKSEYIYIQTRTLQKVSALLLYPPNKSSTCTWSAAALSFHQN
jgi:hypothetical protein